MCLCALGLLRTFLFRSHAKIKCDAVQDRQEGGKDERRQVGQDRASR
ncbi:MAG: hypothetical protein RL156_1727 [Bacteroidota bacterium]|jgi:hypothetical protein